MKNISGKRLAMVLALVLIGAIVAASGSALACHTKTVSCSPSTEQDITDYSPNNWVQYDITLTLQPGCSSYYYVAFTVDPAPPGWSRTLTNDASQNVINPTAPTGPEPSGYNWIDLGDTGGTQTYDVHLKVTAPGSAENNDQAVITVNCWSTDGAVNDLENDPVTTTTTVNIPNGIRLYPKHSLLMSLEAYPGDTKEFDIEIKNLGEAGGAIDFAKDQTTYYEPNGGGDWTGWGTLGTDYSFTPNPSTLGSNEHDTTETRLSVTVPTTAKQSDKLVFVTRGTAQADPLYTHTTTCFVNIIEHLPDIQIDNDGLTIDPESPRDGDDLEVKLMVYNVGGKDVSNFDLEFKLVGEEHKFAPEIKTVTDTIAKEGSSLEVIFNLASTYVTEGEHTICIEADTPTEAEPNGLILEEDEDNNLAGLVFNVGSPRVKWIDGTIELEPDTCNPEDTITVSGTAKYNADFNNDPVNNGDVTIEIEGTTITDTTKTDSTGFYTKEMTAPVDCKTYKVTVDIEDSESVGLKNDEKLEALLEVRSLAVTIDLNPDYAIGGTDVMASGKVKDPDYAVAGASVTITIEGETGSWNVFSDGSGVYSTMLTAPSPTVWTEYTVTATAIKGELMGSASDKLAVDIDTDEDGYGNEEDDDDDGDDVDDETEEAYGSDPLDPLSLPDVDPVALIAGEDMTIYEGDTVNFDGKGSSDSFGGTITEYTWDFGDGESGTGDSPSHQFTDVGNYAVKLSVEDNDNNVATDTLMVNVLDKPPEAELSCDKTSEDTDNTVDFDASGSTCVDVDTIDSYEWDWNYDGADFDPSGDTGAEQSHKWSSKGDYQVAVRVTDDDGSTDIASYSIKINEADTGGILGGSGSGSESGMALVAILVVVVIAIIIAVVFMFKRKGGSKPPETKKEERVQNAPKQESTTAKPETSKSQQERDWNWDFRD
jgi:hypothetical protein